MTGFRSAWRRGWEGGACVRRGRGPIPPEAWTSAEGAYRSAARDDLRKAIASFLDDSAHQRRCFEGLVVESPGALIEGVEELRADLAAGT